MPNQKKEEEVFSKALENKIIEQGFSRMYEIEKIMTADAFEPLRDLEYYHEQARKRNRIKLLELYKKAVASATYWVEDNSGEHILWVADCENVLGNLASYLSECEQI